MGDVYADVCVVFAIEYTHSVHARPVQSAKMLPVPQAKGA